MLKWIQKHPKIWIIVACLAILISALAVWQRHQFKQNSTETKLTNPPRNEEAYTDSFYPDQLTDREKAAYAAMKEAMEQFKGGELVFPEPLNGKEFTRAYNALEYGAEDYFYGMIGIPMTAENQNLTYKNDNITTTEEEIIAKCMLILYPAEGVDKNGKMDDDGYVTNQDELKEPMSVMNPERKTEVEKIRAESEAVLDKVVAEMPPEYGAKEAIDYFLKWVDENLTYDDGSQTGEVEKMSEFFPAFYFKSHRSCVVEQKASFAGYARVLSALCNRAGIPSHVVMGTWTSKYLGSNKASYILTCVEMDGENIYVDASGAQGKDLMDQRYISEAGAMKWMNFVDYFEYKKEQ